FSGSQPPYLSKNWFSGAHAFRIPLAVGLNLGLEKDSATKDNRFFMDLGLHSKSPVDKFLSLPKAVIKSGVVGYNLLNRDNRAIRGGLTLEYNFLRASFELNDLLATHYFSSYLSLGGRWIKKDFAAEAGIGISDRYFTCGLNFNFLNFNSGITYIADPEHTIKFNIGLAFKQRVIEKTIVREKEVEKIKEVVVEKPIFIDRVVEKPSREKKYDRLTLKQKRFLKEHYQLGIKYYTEGNLQAAIAEWEKVYAICPEYENVEINLTNTKEKLKKIEQGNRDE
ncbi:MAG: hypothetical protein ABIL05_04580, partial [candidate division WOR-3 bacterium]